MKNNLLRNILAIGIVAVLGISAVLLFAPHLAPATAQEMGELWDTSAEAPAGLPAHLFSPPDLPETAVQDIAPHAPDALVSWRTAGSALKPRENDVSYSVSGSGACAYVTSGDTSTVWNLTPMLPQGAVVDTLRMYVNDTSASNSSAWFTIYDLYGNLVDEWSVISNSDVGNSFSDSATIGHTIDYTTYSYLLNWRPGVTGSSMQLCGFRIFYEPPPFGLAFLPTVMTSP